MEDQPITVEYRFILEEGRVESFPIRFDEKQLVRPLDPDRDWPAWVALDVHRCPHCPLDPSQHALCPLAASLVDLVSRFDSVLSYDRLQLEVRSPGRTVRQESSAQLALSSLMGLVSATSGCPHTAFFRPMARFHLPMADGDETSFRALSTWALGRFFRHRRGETVDFDVERLRQIYRDVELVNSCVARRIREVSETDAILNALVQLDNYAKILCHILDDVLDRFDDLFRRAEVP